MEYKGKKVIFIKNDSSGCGGCVIEYGSDFCRNSTCADGVFMFAKESDVETFTADQIRAAYTEWSTESEEANSFVKFLEKHAKTHSDPEFAEYQRLKEKFGS